MMQEILDRAQAHYHGGQEADAFNDICEAIALLSRAQQQTMKDLDRRNFGEVPIGGDGTEES